MIKLVKCYLENKSRPEKFRRDYKILDEIKDSNPNLVNKKASNTIKPVKVRLHYQKKRVRFVSFLFLVGVIYPNLLFSIFIC